MANADATHALSSWWVTADDESRPVSTSAPRWQIELAEASRAELRVELELAGRLMSETRGHLPSGAWERAWSLLSLRIEVRRARQGELEGCVSAIRAILDATTAPEEISTNVRAAHLLGVCMTRLARLDEAQRVLAEALDRADELTRVRMLDSLAVVWQAQGAWEEARRTFAGAAALKRAANDVIGVAISEGSRARLELAQGEPERAHRNARSVLDEHGQGLPAMTAIRLSTTALEAAIAMGDAELRRREAIALVRRLAEITEGHYLRGYAAVALARSCELEGEAALRDEWLARAEEQLTLPAQKAIVAVWRARLARRDPDWYERVMALCPKEAVTEPEVDASLLRASELHERGEMDAARAELGRISARATTANHPEWVERIDRIAEVIDPEGAADRIARRFTGRPLAELARTRRERVTIVFVDLVRFTPRSQSLEPEEVMATVRSLFELSTPILTKHRVQPLTYMGDGLLAVAHGEGHEARGLSFALDLIERCHVATRVRTIGLGETWGLDVRAGVASGEVVLGLLGSYLKREFAAIGLTTNLASRLQGTAAELEVVCTREVASAAGIEGPVERLELKGFPKGKPVAAVRIRPKT